MMETVTSSISVQVDSYDKEIANGILKNLGLNMSTFVNMAIKQLIMKDGIPFEVSNRKPKRELIEALQEGEAILAGQKKVNSYQNVREMFEDILSENND